MISPLVPFQVAAENIPGLVTGQLVRHGAILKDVNTGRIVAHLQETGLLNKAVSAGVDLAGSAVNPVGGLTSVFSIIQNEQIKSRLTNIENLMGGMKTLQLATLATSVVGIGVTMASTAIILNRIKQLDGAVQRMESKVDALPKVWQEMQVLQNLVELRTHLARVDDAVLRPDADKVVTNAEEKLEYAFDRFADATQTLTTEITIDAAQLRILLSALSICAGAQFKALLYLDQKEFAQKKALDQNRKIEQLTWNIPQDILEIRLGEDKDQAQAMSSDASELRIRLSGRPHLLQTMIAGNIHGRDYIERSQQKMEEPLLLLPTQDAA
jgi:hypothetical protein